MKKLAPLSALLSLPVPALAAGGPEVAGSVARMFGSLILVIGIILILYYLVGRFLKMPQGGGGGYIRIVETKHLAPKKSLMLVEVGGEYFLLSNSGEGVQFIKQVDLVEEIEVLPEYNYAALVPEQLKNKLKALSADLPAGFGRLAQLKKSGDFA